MDLQIRFYDDTVGEVLTRYLDSRFVYRPNAKMSMLGMDGPNVNWLIFDKLNGQHEKHNHSPLYNFGSCGLHFIHGAFETGMISCGWEISKIMKSVHKLFDKSPARSDVFLSISSLNTFPKQFVMPFSIFYGQAMNSCYITITE